MRPSRAPTSTEDRQLTNGQKHETGPALEQLFTAKQVADVLQLHAKTVERMARQGRLPSLRVCGRVRFLGRDIASWLAARRTACHD